MLTKSDMPSDAGLVAFQNETHNYFLGVRLSPHGERTVFLEKRSGPASPVASASLPANVRSVTLKIEGAGARYRFFYRIGNKPWGQLGGDQDGTILSTKTAGGFVGTYIGLFARTMPQSK